VVGLVQWLLGAAVIVAIPRRPCWLYTRVPAATLIATSMRPDSLAFAILYSKVHNRVLRPVLES
jgi:hypothetical protein